MRTIGDIIGEVLVRLEQGTTSAGLYTDTIMNNWVDQAHIQAATYKKWPFTEGRVTTTWASSAEEWNFEGYRGDSFRFIQVGVNRLQKVNFEDYQIYREKEPSGDDRIFSDFGRTLFINPNADVSGTLTAYGQYRPTAFDTTDPTLTTVFTDAEEDGNEAMVRIMLSYAKTREKKLNQADVHLKNAVGLLDNIWDKYKDEQFAYHSHDRNMWERIDVLRGATNDELIKRDQFF